MNEFLKFFEEKSRRYPMHLNISYSRKCDWCIHIYKRGNTDDERYLEIVYIESCDMEYAFAKAQVMLKDFLYNHGYYQKCDNSDKMIATDNKCIRFEEVKE